MDIKSQNIAELRYKIDTGSDRNLMPINMLKILFPRIPLAELNKCINENMNFIHAIIQAYNNQVYAE